MPYEEGSTVFAGQDIQTHDVNPLDAPARIGNTNISVDSGAMSTLRISESWYVSSDETDKAYWAKSHFLSVTTQLSNSRHLICLTQHYTQISLNNRKSLGLLTTWVIGQGSRTTALPPIDSTASASLLVSAMLVLEWIVSAISHFFSWRKEKNGRRYLLLSSIIHMKWHIFFLLFHGLFINS